LFASERYTGTLTSACRLIPLPTCTPIPGATCNQLLPRDFIERKPQRAGLANELELAHGVFGIPTIAGGGADRAFQKAKRFVISHRRCRNTGTLGEVTDQQRPYINRTASSGL
jgi:hypothetical protein